MMEIRNGKTKRMIALLAQDSTLSLLQAMRSGSWLSSAELESSVGLEREALVLRLEALVSLGVVGTRDDGVRRWKLLQPRISLEVDLLSLPPGPGYILDVVRFYLNLLSNILGRCSEVGGARLREAALDAITQLRLSLPDRERALLQCLRPGTGFGPCLHALENRILAGELTDGDLAWVRAAYVAALRAVADRLKVEVDDSAAKLIFRLAARELLRDGAELAERFALLEGIPPTYLKQVECATASY
jgi:hypothetical protein